MQREVEGVGNSSESEIVYDLVPKLVYGDREINWKYAFGVRRGIYNVK